MLVIPEIIIENYINHLVDDIKASILLDVNNNLITKMFGSLKLGSDFDIKREAISHFSNVEPLKIIVGYNLGDINLEKQAIILITMPSDEESYEQIGLEDTDENTAVGTIVNNNIKFTMITGYTGEDLVIEPNGIKWSITAGVIDNTKKILQLKIFNNIVWKSPEVFTYLEMKNAIEADNTVFNVDGSQLIKEVITGADSTTFAITNNFVLFVSGDTPLVLRKIFSVKYSLILITPNSDLTVVLYRIMQAMFLSYQDELEVEGLKLVKFSGGDLVADKSMGIPDNVFTRTFMISFSYSVSIEQHRMDSIIKKASFNINQVNVS